MKFEEKNKMILFYITYTIFLVFALLNIKFLWNFLGKLITILMPFLFGAVFAFVLNVLLNLIENKILPKIFKKKSKVYEKYKRVFSLILSLLFIVLFFSFLFFLIVPELKNAIFIFVDNLPQYLEEMEHTLEHFGVSGDAILEISTFFNQLKDTGISFVRDNGKEVLGTTIAFATNLVSIITNLVIGIIFALYILAQKEKLQEQWKKICKAYCKEKNVNKINRIFTLSNKICSNFISGQCLEAVIIGVLCFFGMLILRLPYAPTISVLIGFTALIPVFGAFIGTVIGAFLIFMIHPIKAVVFIVFILILQQFEGNLIYPKVVGKSVGLPGIWVMVAVTIGASVAGILGMLVSVPLCSILYSILVSNVHMRLNAKKNK